MSIQSINKYDYDEIIKYLEKIKERESHAVYPDSMEFTVLHDNKMLAMDTAIKAIRAVRNFVTITLDDIDPFTEYGKGFLDGIDMMFDKVDEVMEN